MLLRPPHSFLLQDHSPLVKHPRAQQGVTGKQSEALDFYKLHQQVGAVHESRTEVELSSAIMAGDQCQHLASCLAQGQCQVWCLAVQHLDLYVCILNTCLLTGWPCCWLHQLVGPHAEAGPSSSTAAARAHAQPGCAARSAILRRTAQGSSCSSRWGSSSRRGCTECGQ